MNTELKILRQVNICRRNLRSLKKNILRESLESISTENFPGGTYGLILHMLEQVEEKRRLERFLSEFRELFSQIPKGYRALLFNVYLKNIPCEAIARKFGVSVRTVYRKLCRARQAFGNRIKKLSENTFPEVFSFVCQCE